MNIPVSTGGISDINRRSWLRHAVIAILVGAMSRRSAANPSDPLTVTPEQFGALADGQTDDTKAFQAAADAINRNGGGILRLTPGRTYIVGRQIASSSPFQGYTFVPSDILHFSFCAHDIVIEGNDATLRAPPGYKYGTFDAAGSPTHHRQPYYGPEIAACYKAMIEVDNCSGNVLVRNLNLNGNIGQARIGGGWDDTGWQIPGSGLVFRNNKGRWRCEQVRAFGHGLDGILVDEPSDRDTVKYGSGTTDCDFFENGRQAMSIVGGVGLSFVRSKFRRTRRNTPVQSAPGAGVDLEAEGGKSIRSVSFDHCDFSDNVGAAIVHGGGDVSDILLSDCSLIGTTQYTWYGNAARNVRFLRCKIAGAIVNAEGGPNGLRFESCLLTNQPNMGAGGRPPFSPYGFLMPDSKAGMIFKNGEIRHALPISTVNGNFDGMILDGVRIVAIAGAVTVYGRYRGMCQFIARGGKISGSPGGLIPGTHDTGGADSPWLWITATLRRTFPAVRKRGS